MGPPTAASLAILAVGTFAAYSRTFGVPLLFDDVGSIADNLSIRRLWLIWPVLSPPGGAGVGGRPLLNLSLAANYAVGGTAVQGYHVVNLLIHILASWTLFALVRRTLRSPVLAARFASTATPLALAVSAIWAWHPLQTEDVTYLSQRAESLMGLFYLLTMYCFVRGADAGNRGSRRSWFLSSGLACLAGAATKEVIVTAPLMVLLYDRTFVYGGFRGAWRRHRPLYLGLSAIWLLLACRFLSLNHAEGVGYNAGVGYNQGIAWWEYGLSECRVVVRYLMLAFWPSPLVFDYGIQPQPSLAEVWPYAAAIASLVAWVVVGLRRTPGAAFALCWFLLILAPSSSIVPIAGQPMAESRVYLSLAGPAALAVLGLFTISRRWSLPILAAVAAVLGFASYQRNKDYSSEEAIWSDTVAKNPTNARAHSNLGNGLLGQPGRLNEAITQFEEALRLAPGEFVTHNSLGYALFSEGRQREGIAQIEEALRINPDYPEAHANLGNAFAGMPGHLADAIGQYREAIRLQPGNAQMRNNLGFALLAMPGRFKEAIPEFEEALRLQPDFAAAHYGLAVAFYNLPGQRAEAEAHLESVLRLEPGNAQALQALAEVRGSAR